MRGQDIGANTAEQGREVTMRGQDITSEGQRLADQRAREAAARAGRHYDPERGVVVDTQASTAAPVTMGGEKLPPRDADKALNDSQSKSALFGTRMLNAHNILRDLEMDGTTTSVPGSRTAFGVGSTINIALPANQQKLDQAKRDFLNAVLRRESGAVISDAEFANGDKQYFPQIGDAPQVIEQKSRARELATKGVLIEVPEAKRGKTISEISGKKLMSESDVQDAIKQTKRSREEVIKAARKAGYLIH
jgi:hypothetical protein